MPNEQREKYAIEVTERGIRNKCFDPHVGCVSVSMDGDRLSTFPIDAIVEFLVALQLHFPDVSAQQIVKWPEKIESALNTIGLTYVISYDYKPHLKNIDKENPAFCSQYGRPQVATTGSFPNPYFTGDCAYYSSDVEVFTPERARSMSRLAYTPLFE
jgi:hypothetical protein